MNRLFSAVPVRVILAGLWCLSLAAYTGSTAVSGAAGGRGSVHLSIRGKAVSFGFSGFEPDFDPIDRVVIAATLHDMRPATVALPDAMLVLSAYLENFQPDTTPVLPDLLSPDQNATYVGGFMQGKAALVNAAGHIIFRGSLLAETFLDNSAHIVLDLYRVGAPVTASSLRLKGIFTLSKNLAVSGDLRMTRSLMPPEVAALRVPRVPRGQPVSWQDVVRGLTVHLPPMRGTARPLIRRRLATPMRHAAAAPRAEPHASDRWLLLVALGIVLASTALLWRGSGKKRRPQTTG